VPVDEGVQEWMCPAPEAAEEASFHAVGTSDALQGDADEPAAAGTGASSCRGAVRLSPVGRCMPHVRGGYVSSCCVRMCAAMWISCTHLRNGHVQGRSRTRTRAQCAVMPLLTTLMGLGWQLSAWRWTSRAMPESSNPAALQVINGFIVCNMCIVFSVQLQRYNHALRGLRHSACTAL
jgi:hypothetical protein